MVELLEAVFSKQPLKAFFVATNYGGYISVGENLLRGTFRDRRFSVARTINSCSGRRQRAIHPDIAGFDKRYFRGLE